MLSDVFDTTKGEMVYEKMTICEVHRIIYDLLVINLYKENRELLKDIIKPLEEAFIIGVRMNHRLIKHKCGMDEWADKNDNIEELKKIRQQRINIINEKSNN